MKPKARARHVALDDCLRAGAGAGILIGYQAELLHRVLPRLTSAAWLLLNEALAKVDTELAAAFVLKALAAHRHAQQLPAFAEHVADLGDRKAVAVHLEMGPVPPLDGLEPRALRLHYDPIESLGAGSKSRVSEGFSVQPWPLPMWLRGIPRAPLEMATVAVDQALSNDLRPAERTSGGASDALTAALAPHAETHPSLGRWLLNLCARADSHSGLVHMREAMMRARVEMTR